MPYDDLYYDTGGGLRSTTNHRIISSIAVSVVGLAVTGLAALLSLQLRSRRWLFIYVVATVLTWSSLAVHRPAVAFEIF